MASAADYFPKSYLSSSDLKGRELTATIDRVESNAFENDGKKSVKPVIHFRENGVKPLVCNKTNFLMVAAAYGDDDTNWPGKQIVLYGDLVPFKGTVTEAVRVKRAPAKAASNDNSVPF